MKLVLLLSLAAGVVAGVVVALVQAHLSHQLTIGRVLALNRWRTLAGRAWNLYRAGRLVVNPANAVLGEVWTALRDRAFGNAQQELQGWLLREYVLETGRYAIELYSGRLRLDDTPVTPSTTYNRPGAQLQLRQLLQRGFCLLRQRVHYLHLQRADHFTRAAAGSGQLARDALADLIEHAAHIADHRAMLGFKLAAQLATHAAHDAAFLRRDQNQDDDEQNDNERECQLDKAHECHSVSASNAKEISQCVLT